jgi:hypothetical protein
MFVQRLNAALGLLVAGFSDQDRFGQGLGVSDDASALGRLIVQLCQTRHRTRWIHQPNRHFYMMRELYRPRFHEARWSRLNRRKKFVEITREKFQLTNHPIGAVTRSESRTVDR